MFGFVDEFKSYSCGLIKSNLICLVTQGCLATRDLHAYMIFAVAQLAHFPGSLHLPSESCLKVAQVPTVVGTNGYPTIFGTMVIQQY